VIPHVHSIFTLGARPPTEMLFISVVRYFFVSRFPPTVAPGPVWLSLAAGQPRKGGVGAVVYEQSRGAVQQLLAQYVYQIIARMNKLKEGATN